MKRVFMFLVACAVTTSCSSNAPKEAPQRPVAGVSERAVTFKTTDDLTLTGRLFGKGRVGVTLAHMYPADATSWYPAARQIAQAGYMALAFNFRGYAGSQGEKNIPKAPDDVAAAMRYLKTKGAKDVAFAGASMGGTASLVAASNENAIAVVVLSAPIRFMGLDAGGGIVSHVQRPVLLMASRDDPNDAFRSSQELAQTLPNPVTKFYSGDAHGTNLLQSRPDAVDAIISFLRRWAPVKRA